MVQLQARGEGLCPVNTECTTESMIAFLEREGYTDVRVVSDKPPKEHRGRTSPHRETPKRVVTRRPRT